MIEKIKKILIIQTAFIGDVILTLPVVQVLKKNFKQAEIDFLCIPGTAELLKGNPNISEVIVYDKRNTGTGGMMQLIKLLRAKKYDVIISPHRSSRSAIISKLSRSAKTISFDTSSMSFMYDVKVNYVRSIHEIQRNLVLLEPLGIAEKSIIRPELFISDNESTTVSKFLADRNITANDKIICIAPGSVWFTKRFPEEKFVRVCDLLEESDYKIILIGGSSDKHITKFISDNTKNKNVFDAAGELTIKESADLIRRSGLLIANDSAPLHIANSVGTKVIAIFGATIPEFGFYPYGADDKIIQTMGLKCRPCSIHGGNKCPINTFVCMLDISEEKIAESAQGMMNT